MAVVSAESPAQAPLVLGTSTAHWCPSRDQYLRIEFQSPSPHHRITASPHHRTTSSAPPATARQSAAPPSPTTTRLVCLYHHLLSISIPQSTRTCDPRLRDLFRHPFIRAPPRLLTFPLRSPRKVEEYHSPAQKSHPRPAAHTADSTNHIARLRPHCSSYSMRMPSLTP